MTRSITIIITIFFFFKTLDFSLFFGFALFASVQNVCCACVFMSRSGVQTYNFFTANTVVLLNTLPNSDCTFSFRFLRSQVEILNIF